jgi:hypothetical protein
MNHAVDVHALDHFVKPHWRCDPGAGVSVAVSV